MKIDIFSHIYPPGYREALQKMMIPGPESSQRVARFQPVLYDVDIRFKLMDEFEGYVQVLTPAEPPIEKAVSPDKAAELARIANDGMAELIIKYPDRFVAGVAALPMNDIDAALDEVDRAVGSLNLKGVEVYSNINDKPLDSPEFMPLYEKMEQYDLPIWIHPTGGDEYADYKTEKVSIYRIRALFGWPNETSVAMARLAYSGILERYPKLKIITHHCGGVVPYLAGRIEELGAIDKILSETEAFTPLSKKPVEYLKMFYGDTAIYGQVPALMCGYHFFGPEHMLFGTDMPLGSLSEEGVAGVRAGIRGIDRMGIDDSARKMIYEENARRLLHIS